LLKQIYRFDLAGMPDIESLSINTIRTLCIDDKEAREVDLQKEKHLQYLEDRERQLIQRWPKAYSTPKQRPDITGLAYVFGDRSYRRRGRDHELKFLLYDIDADILHCEARIAEIKQQREAAARAAENKQLRKERQEAKRARIEALLMKLDRTRKG
jgi:hypothetical protein